MKIRVKNLLSRIFRDYLYTIIPITTKILHLVRHFPVGLAFGLNEAKIIQMLKKIHPQKPLF